MAKGSKPRKSATTKRSKGMAPGEAAVQDGSAAGAPSNGNGTGDGKGGAAGAGFTSAAAATAGAAPGLGATVKGSGADQQQQERPLDKISAVGHGVWLMTQSPIHKHLFIADLEWMLLPPIAAGQFRLWRKDNLPLAIATWGFLNEEAEQRLIAGKGRLAPGAWKSGDRLWLMDLIAPFGGKDDALKELRTVVFAGKTIKTLQPDETGQMRVVEL